MAGKGRALLDPERHRGLVADLARYAGAAGVDPAHVTYGMDCFGCGQGEVDWATGYLRRHREGKRRPAGLVYVGSASDVDERMRGLAGSLVRHYVDARVVPEASVVDDGAPQCSVLLVPRCLDDLVAWRRDRVIDEARSRVGRGGSVVLWVGSEPRAGTVGKAAMALVRRLSRVSA